MLRGETTEADETSTVWITGLADLVSTEVPHETASDFDPVWLGKMVYFLSDRNGPISLYRYDPATKAVTPCLRSVAGEPDIRSLSAGPGGLVYDQLGEIYLYDPASARRTWSQSTSRAICRRCEPEFRMSGRR
jgi:tricorn protease